MAEQSKRKAGCFWYLIPALLILGGIALPVMPAIKRAQRPALAKEFLAPGTVEIQITNAGGYTLWYDHSTVFEGRSYSTGQDLPSGLQFTLKNKATGADIPMRSGMNSHVSLGSHERRSVGGFEVSEPGKYELAVLGSLANPAVFSFRENWFLDVFSKTLMLGILGLGAVVAGIVTLVVIFIWRRVK